MAAGGRFDIDVSLAPDPVIEAYKKDVDRTLIRDNLKLTPEQRLLKLQSFMELAQGLRGSSRQVPRASSTGSKFDGNMVPMSGPPDAELLTDDQRAWVLRSEALWREAHAIAAVHPDIDPGDVYHALRCLDLPPAERLRRGLTRVRSRTHAR